MLFTLTNDNAIEAHDSEATFPQEVQHVFASQDDFERAANGWKVGRLVEIWNGMAGAPPFGDLKPVKKFENRTKATRRIWSLMQQLTGKPAPAGNCDSCDGKGSISTFGLAEPCERCAGTGSVVATASVTAPTELAAFAAPKAAKPPKKAKTSKTTTKPVDAAKGTKTAKVVAMLQRKNGATLQEIMTEMGWQAHTVRGFMAGAMKKANHEVESFKPEGGERTYRINK